MEQTKWPALTGLVVGTAVLTSSIKSTFAFDKPFHSSVLFLATLAVALLALARFLPRASSTRSLKDQQYDALPLEEFNTNGGARDHSPHWVAEDVAQPISLRRLRVYFVLLVAAVPVRLMAFRTVLEHSQCANRSWEPWIPLFFALLDYVWVQRRRKYEDEPDEDATVYDIWQRRITKSPYRYLVTVLALCFACYSAVNITSSPPSTRICPATLHYRWLTPLLQAAGTGLDIVVLFFLERLLHQGEGRGSRSPALRFSAVGWAFLCSAVVMSIIATGFYIGSDTIDQHKMVRASSAYVWSTFRLEILLCFTAMCTLICMFHVGTMTTTSIVMFVSVMSATTSYAWQNTHPFPMRHSGFGFLAISLAIVALSVYFYLEASEPSEQSSRPSIFRKLPTWFYLLVLSLFALRVCLWAAHSSYVSYHPIDLLIWDAQSHQEAYLNQTSSSRNLQEAVENYRQRYGKHPPPGFDHWYNYATARNSVVIDDFDSIHRDLLPFRALAPEEIRTRTWQVISKPWNDASGLSFRNGKAEIAPNVMPTHRWMLDGVVELTKNFVEWLPDMDLAFNLNDEPRVAVPYDKIEPMRQIGRDYSNLDRTPENKFSANRGEQWATIPEEEIAETSFHDISFQHSFHRFGSIGCPPNSPARARRHWDMSSACTSCTSPHSLGAFLANWTIAADICHQPDLADMHGVYLAPAAFKGSHELYPVFSQSKAHAFNDILYPSAWNYMNKVAYEPSDEHPDPAFSEKNNTLFWRGATSEGISPGHGEWQGMARQRFNHLANPINDSNPAQPLLIPFHPGNPSSRLGYTTLPVSTLHSFLPTDVHIVETIVRCGGVDCPDQSREFGPLYPPSDFQSHWLYKYLLDLDGAGFSGRFLSFLHSRSLPFKAALFREWWDDRVTPWVHFVPLDIRGHGLWATLAYFAGIEGVAEGKGKEGERIAEAGREWAGKVLRREDMEIYMFRLLLEWGRLTDDRRDDLGLGSG